MSDCFLQSTAIWGWPQAGSSSAVKIVPVLQASEVLKAAGGPFLPWVSSPSLAVGCWHWGRASGMGMGWGSPGAVHTTCLPLGQLRFHVTVWLEELILKLSAYF